MGRCFPISWFTLIALIHLASAAVTKKRARFELGNVLTTASQLPPQHLSEHHRRRLARRLSDSGSLAVGGGLNLGYYYTTIFVGEPSEDHLPQKMTVIVDTGSSLLAVPCNTCTTCGAHTNPKWAPGPSSSSLDCQDPECIALGSHRCDSGQCAYSQSYVEGSSISGKLLSDVLYFGAVSQETWHEGTFGGVRTAVGCQEHETRLFVTQTADGIMGLSAKSNVLSDLLDQDVVSEKTLAMCIGHDGGYMALGSHTYPEEFTTSFTIAGAGYYLVQGESVKLGGTEIANSADLDVHYHGIVLDTGSTYTYVLSKFFRAFYSALDAKCGEIPCPSSHTPLSQEERCYNVEDGTSDELLNTQFPVLEITLGGRRTMMLNVSASQYLVRLRANVRCVGVYDNYGDGSIIGANWLINYKMILEFSTKTVAFVPTDCSKEDEADQAIVQPSQPQVTPTPQPTPQPTPVHPSSQTTHHQSTTDPRLDPITTQPAIDITLIPNEEQDEDQEQVLRKSQALTTAQETNPKGGVKTALTMVLVVIISVALLLLCYGIKKAYSNNRSTKFTPLGQHDEDDDIELLERVGGVGGVGSQASSRDQSAKFTQLGMHDEDENPHFFPVDIGNPHIDSEHSNGDSSGSGEGENSDSGSDD